MSIMNPIPIWGTGQAGTADVATGATATISAGIAAWLIFDSSGGADLVVTLSGTLAALAAAPASGYYVQSGDRVWLPITPSQVAIHIVALSGTASWRLILDRGV
jgi:hypothetical protein